MGTTTACKSTPVAPPAYQHQVPSFTLEALYDLQSGRYLAVGMKNEEKRAWNFEAHPQEQDFTPAAIRQTGIR
ncbi:TPA: DUF1329 domain-containing protein [Pseudomonas aeruginosa]|nr:DUF1329 domain-containing protein [Pseudomonas aeruginosa]MBT1133360.1 DUF1329 domain-containing protein [Pseudomonas sp. PAH14]EIU2666164.1 DUF1329 domain-containing protein [Pseudomonas aeruginosa]EIU2854516.1 DUF1329 domain-containing protein [Pseudomonas aeruginosa]EIU2875112.1 DUF1329 domain-containing protein [Pseudomonas aeruginosa]